MRILKTTDINNNMNKNSFNGARLLKGCLIKEKAFGMGEYVPACFTRLTKKDLQMMREIAPVWEKNGGLGQTIIRNFEKDSGKIGLWESFLRLIRRNKFYMVEKLGEKNPIQRVRSLVMVGNYSDCLYVELLHSANKLSETEKLRGAGEMAIYGLVKLAQKAKKDEINLYSLSDEWYKNIGFSVPASGKIYIPRRGNSMLCSENYSQVLDKLKFKYRMES